MSESQNRHRKCRKRRDLRVTPFSGTNSYLSLLSQDAGDFQASYEEKVKK